MKDALLGFLRAARNAGIEVSPAESIDAFRAIELTGFDDRNAVRGALTLVLGKTEENAERVELVFDRYFGGDGRTNYGETRVDLVQKLHERAKRVVWLNPEDRGSWGTDDSAMLRYQRFTHVAQTCNRLRHLERFVEDLLQNQHG